MSDISDFNENKSGGTKKFVTSWAGSCAIDFTISFSECKGLHFHENFREIDFTKFFMEFDFTKFFTEKNVINVSFSPHYFLLHDLFAVPLYIHCVVLNAFRRRKRK